MSLCANVEAIERRADDSRRFQQPLPATPDVLHYARGLKAKTLQAADVPERLRNAVQECLLLMYETRKRS